MKGLTLWQPWASLVALGAKRIETRSWSSQYRGLLLIHAAMKWDRALANIARAEPFASALGLTRGDFLTRRVSAIPRPLFTGGALAVARIAECRNTATMVRGPGGGLVRWVDTLNPAERAFGDFSGDRYGWILEDVRPLTDPIICAGGQLLWNVPPDLERRVLAALADSPGIPAVAGKGVDRG